MYQCVNFYAMILPFVLYTKIKYQNVYYSRRWLRTVRHRDKQKLRIEVIVIKGTVLTMWGGQLTNFGFCHAFSKKVTKRCLVNWQVFTCVSIIFCRKSFSLSITWFNELIWDTAFTFCICSMILAFSRLGTRPKRTAEKKIKKNKTYNSLID